jgi:hypothetical protein
MAGQNLHHLFLSLHVWIKCKHFLKSSMVGNNILEIIAFYAIICVCRVGALSYNLLPFFATLLVILGEH